MPSALSYPLRRLTEASLAAQHFVSQALISSFNLIKTDKNG